VLPPEGSCLLGSINLTRYVLNPFTKDAQFDFDLFAKNIQLFTRMLDNVVEINGLPLEGQRREIFRKRRHGMGFLGLGSSLTMLGIPYGSPESIQFANDVSKSLALNNFRVGVDLAKTRGAAPIFDEEFKITTEMISKNKNLQEIQTAYSLQENTVVSGKDLFCLSEYFDNWKDDPEASKILEEMKIYGSRFSHGTSIAPTGTIALSFGNNASNGVEPSFSHHYIRNVIKAGQATKVQMNVYSFEYLLYKEFYANEHGIDVSDIVDEILLQELSTKPEWANTDSIDPFNHVKVQASCQKWIDSSISKTINIPTDYAFEKFQDIYMFAYESKLKGCTTFRYNPENFQGVLVTKENLDNTKYEFVTENGEKIVVSGNDTVVYNGKESSAANLFDALKENYYGKL
jgi:ribonucleoside-diphosphate reductase alpha chain